MVLTYTFFVRNKFDEIIGDGQAMEKNIKNVTLNLLNVGLTIEIFRADNLSRETKTSIRIKQKDYGK